MKKWTDEELRAAGDAVFDKTEVPGYVRKLSTALDPLDRETRAVVIDEIIAAFKAGEEPADRIELLAELHGFCREMDGQDPKHALSLDVALATCGLMPAVLEIEQRAKELVLPEPTTATNVETLLMGHGWWLTGMSGTWTPDQLGYAMRAAIFRNPLVRQCSVKLALFVDRPLGSERSALMAFASAWFRAAFARLEIGHKLAASLCLTDIPDDVEVRAPWEVWSLVIPDGLLGALARVWCLGTEPVFMVTRGGTIHHRSAESEDHVSTVMLRALVRGACLALSNPDEFRKENQHGPTARAQHKSNRHGPPDMLQARFFVSAPVKVDVREHVARALSGQTHASPTMQFLVRGHWRNQAHGPKHSLRKTIWVQPFWKGDPDTLILLRQHRVEDPPKDLDPPNEEP